MPRLTPTTPREIPTHLKDAKEYSCDVCDNENHDEEQDIFNCDICDRTYCNHCYYRGMDCDCLRRCCRTFNNTVCADCGMDGCECFEEEVDLGMVYYPNHKINTDDYESMQKFLRKYNDDGFNLTEEDREDDSHVLQMFIEHLTEHYPNRFIMMRVHANSKYMHMIDRTKQDS